MKPLKERFAQKVSIAEDGCHLWTGHIYHGYGRITIGKKAVFAHRLSWEFAHGPIPDGKVILHTCDVRHCVNPHHLRLGTQADNVRDRHLKGRDASMPGDVNPNSKLTVAGIIEIRSSQASNVELAKRFGVSYQNIWMIRARETWSHIA